MRGKRAFTLIELLVVITIIALLIGILLPSLGAARRTARQVQNSTQIRGIHSGMILYAQNNGTFYPGLAEDGTTHPDGTDPSTRLRILLDDSYFTGELMVAPIDRKAIWTTDVVTTGNFSYAMLQLGLDGAPEPERVEWRDTVNAEAVVLADRPIGSNDGVVLIRSIWTSPSVDGAADWRGSVGWNDNHVSFEADHILDVTKYASRVNIRDNLFESDPPNEGADATMTYLTDETIKPYPVN